MTTATKPRTSVVGVVATATVALLFPLTNVVSVASPFHHGGVVTARPAPHEQGGRVVALPAPHEHGG